MNHKIIDEGSTNDMDRLYVGVIVRVNGELGVVTGVSDTATYILRYDGSIVRVDDPHSHNIKRTTLLVPAISDILDDMKEFNDLEELVDSFTINNI